MSIKPSASFFAFLFLVLAISVPAFADSDHHNRYFLAPDITASGTVINEVDVASGKLNRSDTDLSSSTLDFSRMYSGSGLKAAYFGGWNHSFASQLVVDGLSYANWRGIKSNQYNGKSKACVSGWNDIRGRFSMDNYLVQKRSTATVSVRFQRPIKQFLNLLFTLKRKQEIQLS